MSMLAKNLKILRSNVQKFEAILDNNVVIFAHVDWSGLLHKLMQNLACRLVHGADFGNGAYLLPSAKLSYLMPFYARTTTFLIYRQHAHLDKT